MKPETFYKQKGYPEIKDRLDKNVQMFTYWDIIEFAEEYHNNEREKECLDFAYKYTMKSRNSIKVDFNEWLKLRNENE